MVPLIQVRRSFFLTKTMQFFYTVLMIFAILLCITFYVMNSMELGGDPTQKVIETSIINMEPPIIEKTDYLGKPNPPRLEVFEKITQGKLQNKDTVGWLNIPNTNIDYPVVQYEDNDYYLRRGFDGRYKFAGTLYADFRVTGNNRTEFYKNSVIYGHNINQNHKTTTGEMFAQLMKFKDLEFAQENQYIYYSTDGDEMIWEIFSVFYNGEDRAGNTEFYHIEIEELNNDITYQNFLDEVLLRSEYDYGVELTTEDKIITLSTCSYKYGIDFQQYLVVMARIVPSNEEGSIKEVKMNEEKKIPHFIEERAA